MFDTFASLIAVAPRRSALQTCLALLLVVLLSCCAEVLAEDYPTPAFPDFPAQASNQSVAARVSPIPFEFNGPSTLESLIEFVSLQLDLGILYGDEIQGESITIRQATGAMDKSALRPFLESVLRMKGFSLVDDLAPGFARVIPLSQAAANMPAATEAASLQATPPSQVITRVFALKYQNAADLVDVLSSFLTPADGTKSARRGRGAAAGKAKGNRGLFVVESQNSLIVIDFADNIQRVAALIEQLDVRVVSATIEAIPLQHASGKELVSQIKRLLEIKAKAGESKKSAAAQATEVLFDNHSNQLLIVGSKADIPQIAQTIRQLDVPIDDTIRDYEIRYGSVQAIAESLHQLIDISKDHEAFKSAASLNNNRLIVQASPAIHQRIAALLKEIDVRQPDGQGRLRTHHLQHVTAAQILVTMQGLGANTTSTNSPANSNSNAASPGQSTPTNGGSGAATTSGGTSGGASGASSRTRSRGALSTPRSGR